MYFNQGVGANNAAAHPAIQTPNPTLHPITMAGVPNPAVTVPNVTPAAV